ncbi:MAG: DUF4861 family protein [Bacteroidales bacterium]|jgi:hypothetical protein|nr:DUF4861 family protein [Bacteroidales bacterium]
MKKALLIMMAALSALAGCKTTGKAGDSAAEPKDTTVMARFVPERMDDFVFENDLIAGRFYGKALEGNPTSPGIDIWVKLPGKLVANEWYAKAMEDGGYYHRDHGGKDCYKVAVSLGGGASAVMLDGKLHFPATNYRSYDILSSEPDSAVFVLHYPEWEVGTGRISLDKKVTVVGGTYFCKVEDTYTFSGLDSDSLTVAAGIFRHPGQGTIEEEISTPDRIAIWEKASDQSVEPEDGMIGVAVIVPGASYTGLSTGDDHSIAVRTIASGETFSYMFGSCWSKGSIKDADSWFELVKSTTVK